MEVQSECMEPPAAQTCDPQPTGKINKAAFKLFGKRRTGSGMASFFSFRNKGATNNGNNGNSEKLIRSKTHDGLTGTNNDADGQRGEGLGGQEAGPVRSLSKSLSFFSLLRRGSLRASENGGAGLARRGRGLKGLFSSMRWRRKDKTNEGEGEDHGNSEAEPNLQAVETPTASVTMTPPHCVAMPGASGESDSVFPFTPTDSPLHPPISKAKASISSLTPSLATPPLDRCSVADPPSEPSVDRLCSLLFNDVTSLKSFDSLTGCGDIIADAEEEGPVGNGGSGTSSSSSGGGGGTVEVGGGKGTGIISSGVVAYMGGGEEMASPEGVDDADMQGLWHIGAERKVPQVKALGLSKIPVVGVSGARAAKPPLPHTHARHPTSPSEKEPLSDEGYWDTPSATPTATPDEGGLQRNQKLALSRDSCSGDHLYDLYNDPEDEGEDEEQEEREDLTSTPSPTTENKLSSTSLPRESKIPVSTRQTTPPHSASQSSLSSVLESSAPPPKTEAPPPARTRIPVSKVPVRRSGNKPGNTTRGPTHRK
uniref:APC membrane recruitment protein 2 n=1 Tax=Myripristis murdjan TaxID=586833 RepID=A0A667YR77_9TELE